MTPTAPSLLHASATLVQLLDDEAGSQIKAHDLLRADRVEVLRLKHRLQLSRLTGQGRILCAICGVPVYLAAQPNAQTFVFRHFHEDGNCPHITREGKSVEQINAYKYNAQRESARHKRLKATVAESVRCDPHFSEPVTEGTIKVADGHWRRPDVHAWLDGQLSVAFEIQLSTTFGSVMAEREEFYRKQGGLLLWVFGEFDPEHARLMMQVVHAVNNRNCYVVNDDTLTASRQAGALMLECHWDEPGIGPQGVVWLHKRRLVRFDELTLDQERQRAYFVDTERLETELQRQIQGPPLDEQLEAQWLDIEAFQGRARPELSDINARWHTLQKAFNRVRVNLPSWHYDNLIDLLRVLYSAKHGAPVGWGFKGFWDAAHHVFAAHRQFLWIFYAALEAYGRLPALEAQDKSRRWRKKVQDWKLAPDMENHAFDALIAEAFPVLAEHVCKQRGDLLEWEEAPF